MSLKGKTNILKNVSQVFVLTLMYRILGFVREMCVAAYLGTSFLADAYAVAYSFPSLIVEVMALGAMSSVIIPVAQKYMQQENRTQNMQKLYARIFSAVIFLLIIVLIICELFAVPFVSLLAPEFTYEEKSITTYMIRYMLPAILFIGLQGVNVSFLQIYKDFVTPGLSHLAFNGVMVCGALLALFTDTINTLLLSFVVASMTQCIVQHIGIKKSGLYFKFNIDFINDDIKRIFSLMFPVMLGTIATQLYPVVARALASGYEVGIVSAISYSNKLIQLPVGLIAGALVSVTFTRLAENASNSNHFAELSNGIFKLLLILFIPIWAIIMGCSYTIINIVYERGAFATQDTILTAKVLFYYSSSVLIVGMTQFVNNDFYALKKTKEPAIVGLCSLLVGGGFAFCLARLIDGTLIPFGLALGNALGLVYLLIRINSINRGMTSIKSKEILFCVVAFTSVLGASVLMDGLFRTFLLNLNIFLRFLAFGCFVGAVFFLYIFLIYRNDFLDIKKIIKMLKRDEEKVNV